MTVQQIKQRYGIIGNDRRLDTAVEMAIQVAPTDVSVLIYGENGVGKDVFSSIIHDNSKRKHKRLIAINTGAIAEGILDSELFGHEKGAFTSAYETRKGYFEEAEGGTIFLDEIGEMPLATQARLLRLLENGEYLRVGSSKVRVADVRVITATNRNLLDMIREARFREDLYFRINAITLSIPPLRDRGPDIEMLFNYFSLEFAEKYKREPLTLAPEAIPILLEYHWPGNIRELRNLVEKLTVLIKENWVSAEQLSDHMFIQRTYLPSIVRRKEGFGGPEEAEVTQKDLDVLYKMIYDLGTQVQEMKKMIYLGIQNREADAMVPAGDTPPPYYSPTPHTNGERPVVQEVPRLEEPLSIALKEKELIIKALNKHNNNRKKAAQDLGISERTLYRKIKENNITS